MIASKNHSLIVTHLVKRLCEKTPQNRAGAGCAVADQGRQVKSGLASAVRIFSYASVELQGTARLGRSSHLPWDTGALHAMLTCAGCNRRLRKDGRGHEKRQSISVRGRSGCIGGTHRTGDL